MARLVPVRALCIPRPCFSLTSSFTRAGALGSLGTGLASHMGTPVVTPLGALEAPGSLPTRVRTVPGLYFAAGSRHLVSLGSYASRSSLWFAPTTGAERPAAGGRLLAGRSCCVSPCAAPSQAPRSDSGSLALCPLPGPCSYSQHRGELLPEAPGEAGRPLQGYMRVAPEETSAIRHCGSPQHAFLGLCPRLSPASAAKAPLPQFPAAPHLIANLGQRHTSELRKQLGKCGCRGLRDWHPPMLVLAGDFEKESRSD